MKIEKIHYDPNDLPYEVIRIHEKKPIKAWVKGVALEAAALQQLINLASMPFIHKHIAVMPDAHMGKGTTVGTVIPTFKAIIPAAVGVDLGCGMIAMATTLKATDLPDNLRPLRAAIENAVPVGKGFWHDDLAASHPAAKPINKAWSTLSDRWDIIAAKHPKVDDGNYSRNRLQLGTLGSGNHFIKPIARNRPA